MSEGLPPLNRRAVSLLSGGLDSLLSATLVSNQGIEVKAITFATDFGCGTGTGGGCGTDTRGLDLGFDIKFCHLGDAYNRMVKNPRWGYGKNMNPCIDCRLMMLRAGWEYAEACGATWLITGEVLQQRPMSQRKPVMAQVEKELGLGRRILRPLSARLLPHTEMEEAGIIDRAKLENISGRSRKRQMAMAEELGITDYPTPAGGCLLTDPQHARKVRDLFRFMPAETPPSIDVRLLQFGRNFRLSPQVKFIVGRNQEENEMLASYVRPDDWLLVPQSHIGPSVLVIGADASHEELETAARIGSSYGKGDAGDRVAYQLQGPAARPEVAVEKPGDRQWFLDKRI